MLVAGSIGRDSVAINGARRSRTRILGGVFAAASKDRRCAKAAARRERAHASIPGRLIEHAVAVHSLSERRRIGILRHLEGVEAGAMQKQQLIAQDLTRCTQLAAKLIAFAQEPGLTVGASVAEVRKAQSDERDPVEIWSELGNLRSLGQMTP